VAVGNGSDELGRLVCEAFLSPGDEGLCSASAFIRFRQWAALMGSKARLVPEREHRHDLDALARAVGRRTKLVFIASPNNPTGTYCSAAGLEAFLRRVPRRVLVLLDEAYYEYAARRPDYPRSLPGLLRRHPNLVVLRTFSKAYGLAGLRVGWMAARPELTAWVDRIRMPFNVSLPAQEAARAALADAAHVRRGVDWVEAERPRLARELERRGLRVVPSSANFVMAEAPVPAEELFRRLLRRGVIVRPLAEYGLERHLRISIGGRSENRRLLAALDKELR
jgi:histidinol-phosphate aminotransferase